MPRPPRLHVPGGIYHVILRGNHRQPIFFREADRDLLAHLLSENSQRFSCRIHAFCWMGNHIHLALQIGEAPLGRLMQRLASQYARTVQKRIPTTGHLFERRYRAILVDADAYLLELIRYIHLNPVRAGIVADPIDWAWSSHRAYLGIASIPWLTCDFALAMWAPRRAAAQEAYRRFMRHCTGGEELQRLRCGREDESRILGDDRFLAGIATHTPHRRPRESLDELVERTVRELCISETALLSRSRMSTLCKARFLIARRAIDSGTATLAEVARRLQRSPHALGSGIQRHKDE